MATAVALAVIAWLVWSLATHRSVLPYIDSAQSSSSVTIGLTDAPDSLDIRTDDDPAVERALLGNVYETLVSRDDDNSLHGGLAKQWEISDDGLTYTFTLRRNLRFSNGHTLDSSDVVWSLEQIINDKYQGSDELSALKSVDAPDSSTITLTLNTTDPTLLRALAGRAGIVYDSQAGIASYANAAVGSGPFTVAGWRKGESITLERNDDYWGKAAQASRITLKYYADDNALAKAMNSSALDLALPDDPATAKTMAEIPSVNEQQGSSTSQVILALNNDVDSIFSDQQARTVVQYAVDKQSIAASQTDSAGALGGPIGPLEDGYEDLTGLYPYDPGKASSGIAYFAGGSGYFGTLDFVVPQRYKAIGDTVTSQLEAVGLSVNMEVLDDAAAAKRIADGDYTIAVMELQGDDAAMYGTASNVFHYDSGTAQQAYAKAMSATNGEDYQAGMKLFARAVAQDAACDWLYTRATAVAAYNRISGYPVNMTDAYLPLAGIAKR